ncbi:MAG TPA: GatB/YqeY domain-containing protein [Bryobacteraceae bacterium]|nr:GatB/YqeY domain-containing protein [Bryobacteraceae bacterium]
MPLIDQLSKDITEAMKARDEERLSTVRMMKAALMKAHVDAAPKQVDDAGDLQVLKILVKQRTDAAEMFRKGGREDAALKEEAQRTIIEGYLPAGASEEDMNAAIEAAIAETGATSAKQMGLVMKAAQARLAGKTVDGKALSEKVKARLA